jgi:transposase InsO family protein
MDLGWLTRPTIARELVLDAVLMAVRRRRPRGTVIHSDQGSQYGSDDWRHRDDLKKRVFTYAKVFSVARLRAKYALVFNLLMELREYLGAVDYQRAILRISPN